MTKRIAPVLVVLTVALAACGRTATPTGPDDTNEPPTTGFSYPTSADEAIITVESGGGFVPMEYNLTALPGFTLTGDGSIYVPGPMIEIYPPPAVPAFQVQTVDEAGIQAILQAADDAGLLKDDQTFDHMFVSDAPTTTFTITADDVEHTTSVYALGMGTEQLEEPAKSDIQKIEAFNTKLMDLQSWLPEGSLSEQSLYEPERMQLYVLDAPRADPEIPQKSVDWPLDEPLAEFGAEDTYGQTFRCGIVAGEDMDAVLGIANETNQQTPWVSDGKEYQVLFKPLLPNELGCVADASGGTTTPATAATSAPLTES